MSIVRALPSLALVLSLFACASAQPHAAAAASTQSGATADASATFEKVGIVAPSDFAALSIWPEHYQGGFLVLEVLPHGSRVAAGDVLATLDLRDFDEELHRMELEAQSARLRHTGLVERGRLDEQAANSQLAQSKAGLVRAERSLEGWKRFELAFAKRQDELMQRWENANVEDQKDELDQLDKMFKGDELVDATEVIVVKRAQRSLDTSEFSNRLSRDQARYRESFDQTLQTEEREERVRVQAEAHGRLVKQTELDGRARDDGELRSDEAMKEQLEKFERMRRDREKLVLRAPREGVLLHGSAKDYRPGRSPTRLERGSQISLRQDLMVVASHSPSTVAFELDDQDLAKLPAGTTVQLATFGAAPASAAGQVEIEAYPRSASASEALFEARAVAAAGLDGAIYGARAKLTYGGSGAQP